MQRWTACMHFDSLANFCFLCGPALHLHLKGYMYIDNKCQLGQHRWHSIACFGWTQHRTPWSGNPGYWMFENARQHYFYWRSTIMALKLTLLFFLSVWHMGKKKTKFGQIINSSHSSIIHSDSKTAVNLDLLSKSPWRPIRRSTCIPLYCHDFYFFWSD